MRLWNKHFAVKKPKLKCKTKKKVNSNNLSIEERSFK